MMRPEGKLRAIKILHTVAWAIFAGAIVAVPFVLAQGHLTAAWWLIGLVMLEVAVLLANQMVCPLTDIAARYTDERHDNFDIYLPLWLARNNKRLFGSLFVADVVLVIAFTLTHASQSGA